MISKFINNQTFKNFKSHKQTFDWNVDPNPALFLHINFWTCVDNLTIPYAVLGASVTPKALQVNAL